MFFHLIKMSAIKSFTLVNDFNHITAVLFQRCEVDYHLEACYCIRHTGLFWLHSKHLIIMVDTVYLSLNVCVPWWPSGLTGPTSSRGT